jgi:transposase
VGEVAEAEIGAAQMLEASVDRPGRTLRQRRTAFLGHFDTADASNGGTEAVNGHIELRRGVARGFRNRENERLRMLLIGGGLRP